MHSEAMHTSCERWCSDLQQQSGIGSDARLLREPLRTQPGKAVLAFDREWKGFWVPWQVQDHAAGLVVALLDPQPGETVLDACAAPGGKALYAAARMRGQVRPKAWVCIPLRLASLAAFAALESSKTSWCLQHGLPREQAPADIHLRRWHSSLAAKTSSMDSESKTRI